MCWRGLVPYNSSEDLQSAFWLRLLYLSSVGFPYWRDEPKKAYLVNCSFKQCGVVEE